MNEQQQEFQKQVNLQKIANEKRQMMNERIVKKMDLVCFPANKITERWRSVTTKGLMNTIPVVSKTNIVDFVSALKAVLNPKGDITLNQFQVLANSLDTASPASLGLTPKEYIEVVEEITSTVETWKQLLEKLNNDVMVEVEKEISMRVAAEGNAGKNGLKPIIGEA